MKLNNFTNNVQSLLLNNNTIRQTILKNTFWLTLGTGGSRLLNFVLMIFVARILGATEYGKFAFALAFVSLFAVIADLGISTILVREFAKEKEREQEFHSILSLRVILGIIMLISILVGSFFITQDSGIRKIILILALFTFINSFIDIVYAFFQAKQKMEYQAWAAITGALLLTAFGFFVIFNFPSAENLAFAFFFTNLITLIIIAVFFHLKIYHLKISWQRTVWRKFLLMSWPLAFTGLFSLLYTYIDSVMLGFFGQITENGFYSAAYRIAWTAYIFTGLAVTSFYPILSRAFEESKEKLRQVWSFQVELMTTLAIPLVIGGIILAPRIIEFFYGREFIPSILALQILVAMAGILLLGAAFYQVLLVANHQKKLLFVSLAGAGFNIGLNLILIPKYSLYGAAFASLLTQVLIFLLMMGLVMKFTKIKFPDLKFLNVLAIAMVSGAAMSVVISSPRIFYLNVLFSIAIGILVYFSFLFFLKYTVGQIALSRITK